MSDIELSGKATSKFVAKEMVPALPGPLAPFTPSGPAIYRSHNLTPIVESFDLATTQPSRRLIENFAWINEHKGIRDPEARISRLCIDVKTKDIDYSGEMADLLAYASTWAYADPATFAFMMAHRGLVNWRYYYMRLGNDPLFVVASAYLMQSYTGDVSILVFRGTEPTNMLNWLTDLTINPARFLEGEVHGGILRNFEAIWPLINLGLYTVDNQRSLLLLREEKRGTDDTIASGVDPNDDTEEFYQRVYRERPFDDPHVNVRKLRGLFITGHSLGGAMAALAAAKIWKDPSWRDVRASLAGCYTYGAPMVATPPLAKVLEEALGDIVFRHVYNYDVVPQLPPLTTGLFGHFGREYRPDKGSSGWMRTPKDTRQTGSVLLLPLAGLTMITDQFPWLRDLASRLPISIDHHSPRHYMRVSELSRVTTF